MDSPRLHLVFGSFPTGPYTLRLRCLQCPSPIARNFETEQPEAVQECPSCERSHHPWRGMPRHLIPMPVALLGTTTLERGQDRFPGVHFLKKITWTYFFSRDDKSRNKPLPYLIRTQNAVVISVMVRDVIWLENDTFAALGCSSCRWIVSNPGPISEQAPARIKEAFDKHECADYPRQPPLRRREA